MAGRIAAHITIAYETAGGTDLQVALDRVAASPPITVRLTRVACWGSPERGIFLGVDEVDRGITRIRDAFQVADADEAYIPHVTLVHPRSVAPSRSREAWEGLAAWTLDAEVLIERLTLIESLDTQWRATAIVDLHGQ